MNNNNNHNIIDTTTTNAVNLLNKCNENNVSVNGVNGNTTERQCANCATTSTPLWRKYGSCHFLCNACGLYYRVNGDHRPHVSKISRVSTLRKSFLHCANCGTNKTTMWRRDAGGVHVCNACGLFYRINGFNRPVSMRRDVIRTRKRRDKELMQSQDGSLTEQSITTMAMDIQPIEMPVSGVGVNIKLEDTAKPCSTSSLSSSSVSSNESCSYNYVETNQTHWTTNDVNPLTYIFTESMDYYNTEHSAIS